jgi:hypothetical protein
MTETWILALTGWQDLIYGKLHLPLFDNCFPRFVDISGSIRAMRAIRFLIFLKLVMNTLKVSFSSFLVFVILTREGTITGF